MLKPALRWHPLAGPSMLAARIRRKKPPRGLVWLGAILGSTMMQMQVPDLVTPSSQEENKWEGTLHITGSSPARSPSKPRQKKKGLYFCDSCFTARDLPRPQVIHTNRPCGSPLFRTQAWSRYPERRDAHSLGACFDLKRLPS